MKQHLEVACFNVESALVAVEAGAHRIEFCRDYDSGGLTPNENEINNLKHTIGVPVHVIIRERAGNFVYNELEKEKMRDSVIFCRSHAVDGIVFGALNEAGTIDVVFCKELISLAGKMSLTFHRAIDEIKDIPVAIETLINLGVHRVLSSGGASTAIDGLLALKKMKELAKNKIIVMPGGGIRANQIQTFLDAGFNELHTSAITGTDENANPEEIKKMLLTIQQHV